MSKVRKNPFVVYCGLDEILVTTKEDEKHCIQEWFIDGGRDFGDYDRYEDDDCVIQLRSNPWVKG